MGIVIVIIAATVIAGAASAAGVALNNVGAMQAEEGRRECWK